MTKDVGVRSFQKSEMSEFQSFLEMENIRNSGVSRNQIASKYTYLGNSPEFRVVLESCEQILTDSGKSGGDGLTLFSGTEQGGLITLGARMHVSRVYMVITLWVFKHFTQQKTSGYMLSFFEKKPHFDHHVPRVLESVPRFWHNPELQWVSEVCLFMSGISSFQTISSLIFQNTRLISHEHSFPTWHHANITNNGTDSINVMQWGKPPRRQFYSSWHPQTLIYLPRTRIDRLPGPGRIRSGEYSEPLTGPNSPRPLGRPPG